MHILRIGTERSPSARLSSTGFAPDRALFLEIRVVGQKLRRAELQMAQFIQGIPLVEEGGGLPSALFGLDDDGRLFYGELEYSGPDPGPSTIRWRLVESVPDGPRRH